MGGDVTPVMLEAETIPPSPEDRQRHRAGSAWTDRGVAWLVSGGPGGRTAAVHCHRRAIDLLGQLPVSENPDYMADLATAWVNLGCALLAGDREGSMKEALGAFDRAIELLERLPIDANPRFRHNLAAAWMNRAEAEGPIGAEAAGAAQSYMRAIDIARGLPLDEKPSFRILLGSSWINLGNLRQRQGDLLGAVQAYDFALSGLGELPESGHRLARHHAATAWTNRAEALVCVGWGEAASLAAESARRALEHVEGRELCGAVNAKLGLRALKALAQGLEASLRVRGCVASSDKVSEITDVAERGMILALGSRPSAPEVFDPFIAWFFSFGSRAYGRYQPQFLAEFLGEMLQRSKSHACPRLESELRAIASQAATGALEGLGRGRIFVDGTRRTELLIGAVGDLRNASVQFNS
jgi:tetratricopeptide (TPR) repeat protein